MQRRTASNHHFCELLAFSLERRFVINRVFDILKY